jgi:hypothetical protein
MQARGRLAGWSGLSASENAVVDGRHFLFIGGNAAVGASVWPDPDPIRDLGTLNIVEQEVERHVFLLGQDRALTPIS